MVGILQQRLNDQLMRGIDANISPIYALKHTYKISPVGVKIWKISARARKASECVGWPTPVSSDNRDRGKWDNPSIQRRMRIGKQIDLSVLATGATGERLAEYPTPTASTGGSSNNSAAVLERGHGTNLAGVAALFNIEVSKCQTGYTAAMKNGDPSGEGLPQLSKALNPRLSGWLMGFPPEWCVSAIMAYRSIKKVSKKAYRSKAMKHKKQE